MPATSSWQQLNYLSQIKNWYADGTFKVVRLPFKQLWSIHGFIVHGGQAIQVPLVFTLMSRTRKRDYVRVLEAIVNSCPTPPVVKSCMFDYEQAAWSGFKKVFPTMTLQGGLFHWTQCVWRKIGELGLAGTYFDKDCPELRKYMATEGRNYIMRLPLLHETQPWVRAYLGAHPETITVLERHNISTPWTSEVELARYIVEARRAHRRTLSRRDSLL